MAGPGEISAAGGGFPITILHPSRSSAYLKPLCQTCETRHEEWQAHVFPKVVNTVANVANTVANGIANKNRKAGTYKDPEKRRAYMRDLMRKRRSEQH